MVLWYSLALFTSAALLFLVQPMVGKMVLPSYGGSSAVWNACQFFFQIALLLGYAYAHVVVKWLGPRRQSVVHVVVLLVPLLVLPVTLAARSAAVDAVDPVLGLLLTLAWTVGLPFFALSSSSPLLQRWFASTGHPAARDPYFLFAASNAGSLLGLFAYPLLAEPALTASEQSRVWSGGYALLVGMLLVVALWNWRGGRSDRVAGAPLADGTEPLPIQVTVRRRLFWLVASFVPSSLMLSVTQYATTNIGAVPLLWVLPLGLYLLAFVHAFARRPMVPQRYLVRALPFVVLPFAPLFFYPIRGAALLLVALHLLVFFTLALLCLGELAASRPAPQRLTEFYLLTAVGGAAGGLFNAVIAPALFTQITEYPLAVLLACFLLPGSAAGPETTRQRRRDLVAPLLVAGSAALVLGPIVLLHWENSRLLFALLFAPCALICFGFKERPLRFALGYGVLLVALASYQSATAGDVLFEVRNFYGVKQVLLDRAGEVRSLAHGTVIHGSQYVDPARRDVPLTYFHRAGPLGDVFALYQRRPLQPQVAIIGLGAGAIASYARAGDRFVYYEIDPQVVQIARDREDFTFLADSRGRIEVIIGDGRLALAEAPAHSFGMLIVDAFSSDSIPVHLLTREALALYSSKVEAAGWIVFHISNAYLDLAPVLGKLARERGLTSLIKDDAALAAAAGGERAPSTYVVVGDLDPDAVQGLADAGWQPTRSDDRFPTWTDDYSSIARLLRW